MRKKSEYPELLWEYFKFSKVGNIALKSKIVNISNHNWIYPTFLVPLCNLIINNDFEYIPPSNFNAKNYINTVITTEYSGKSTYVPLQFLPYNYKEFGSVISNLQEWCDNGKNYGGLGAFTFLFNELIDNIYQHSDFKNAYVIAQSYPNKNFSEVCIFDDGISIPKSFENYNISFRSDAHAISRAINGLSTKDEGRGYGLNNSIDMYTKGGNAEFLIVSRNGIFYKKHREPVKLYNTEIMNTTNDILNNGYATFDKEYIPPLEGTLISMRIPYPIPKIETQLYIR